MERDIRWLPFGLLVLYAACTLAWSPDPQAGLIQLQNWVALAGIGTFVALSDLEPRWGVALASLLGLVLFWMLPGLFWGGFGNENFFAEVWLISAAFLWRSPLVLVPLCTLTFSGSDSVLVAALGLAVWALASRRMWWSLAFLGAILANVAVAAVALDMVPQSIDASVIGRLEIWHNTALVWFDHPLFGTGLGGFDWFYSEVQEAHVGLFDAPSVINGGHVIVGAAHNEFIQCLTEFGLLGAALAGWCIWELSKGAGATLPLVVVGSLCLVGFPLQNPATALLFVLACGLQLRSQSACPVRSGIGHSSSFQKLASWQAFRRLARSTRITKPIGGIRWTRGLGSTSR